ncbi:hypothetical protein BOX37_14020 [Nocardia mangyaensis]|uniref:Uncharacterized protein n=1 Tax=Nocardia mangyaensis TaxID=2213200 RepID=A0A1J0VSG3_9NOCA|nr:hypothetical protein [Nocardia mangyaensis]APE34879.1 hypothetical protein BOX37_14020 [Nocardia mangyaensis]
MELTFGTSVNDVAIAAVQAAYRALLLRCGEEPTAETVRILIPVSTRGAEADLAMDNCVWAFRLAGQFPQRGVGCFNWENVANKYLPRVYSRGYVQ